MQTRLSTWKAIQAPTWGLSLSRMRMLYIREIQPILSYGCAAWFVHSQSSQSTKKKQYLLNKNTLEAIDAIQRECLAQISGSFAQTNRNILHRELHLKPASIWLEQRAKVARAWKYVDGKTRKDYHPYDLLYKEAEACHDAAMKAHRQPPTLTSSQIREAIRAEAKKHSENQAREWWQEFQRQRKVERVGRDHEVVGARGEWSDEAFNAHAKLTRAQSTMLIQLRTERIGLRQFLNKMRVCPVLFPPGTRCLGQIHVGTYSWTQS